MPWLTIIQVILLILWYTVDAVSSLSPWIIFIPAIVVTLRAIFAVALIALVAVAKP